jgi:hypothetical protein
MNESFNEFWDGLGDIAEDFAGEVIKAGEEFIEDVKNIHRVNFMRPGAVVFRKSEDGGKDTGIYISAQNIIHIGDAGRPEAIEAEEFASSSVDGRIFVASRDKIALGDRKISKRALLLEHDKGETFNPEQFTMGCLSGDFSREDSEFSDISQCLQEQHGDIEWLKWEYKGK